MKSQYEFEIKEGYLQFNLTGRYDKGEFLSFPEMLKARCEKEGIFKILINGLEVKGSNLSTTDRYFIGERIGLIMQNRIKVAVVWPEKSIDKFAETVALNRGGDMLVVGDYEKAVSWLLSSD
jgi:hypothetical protein